jgi:hypothetical protein
MNIDNMMQEKKFYKSKPRNLEGTETRIKEVCIDTILNDKVEF